MQVQEGSGDRGKGGKVHGVGFPASGPQAYLQEGIGILGISYIALELTVVESLEKPCLFRIGVALEELLHVSGIFEPEKMVHHELMDLEMQVRPATTSWLGLLARGHHMWWCWLCLL